MGTVRANIKLHVMIRVSNALVKLSLVIIFLVNENYFIVNLFLSNCYFDMKSNDHKRIEFIQSILNPGNKLYG